MLMALLHRFRNESEPMDKKLNPMLLPDVRVDALVRKFAKQPDFPRYPYKEVPWDNVWNVDAVLQAIARNIVCPET